MAIIKSNHGPDISDCVDTLVNADMTDASANCGAFKSLCGADGAIGQAVQSQCRKTCGFC